jgi:hypothetical protein
VIVKLALKGESHRATTRRLVRESTVAGIELIAPPLFESEVDTMLLEIEDPMDNNVNLLRALIESGVNVVELAEDEATLEDLYLEVVKGGAGQ